MDRIDATNWVDIGGGRRGFRNQNKLAGLAGTVLAAAWLNGLQEELLKIIEDEGIVLDDENWTQLAQALKRRVARGNYVVDTGAANALAIAPGVSAIAEGMTFLVKLAATITGAATINVDAAGAVALSFVDGTALTPQSALAGDYILIVKAAAGYRLLTRIASEQAVKDASGTGLVEARWLAHYSRILSLNTTLYVRTDGNDGHDGSANTAGSAFLTIQGALDYIRSKFGATGRRITIKLGVAGTYDIVSVGGFASGLTIEGDAANQAGYILAAANGMEVSSSSLVLKGLTLQPGVAGTFALQASSASFVTVEKVTFTGGNGTSFIHILSGFGGLVNFSGFGAAIFSSGGAAALFATANGNISSTASGGVTFSGTPAFANATAVASKGGVIDLQTPGFSIAGGATGKRYDAILGGIINTGGGGANFFPGNAAGTTATGGQYA